MEAADKANRAKTEFLTRMSHELRTPLNAVVSFSHLLLESASGQLDATQMQQLHAIALAGQQLTSLIDGLLDVPQIENGHLVAAREQFVLSELVEGVLSVCAADGAGRGVRVFPLIDDLDEHRLYSDTGKVRQILTNLISNSIKYGVAGGVVEVEIFSDAEWVAVRVSDDGIGMSAQQLEHLYEPYNRLGRENGPVPGMGIGLSLSRQLAVLLGGSLDIVSTPNIGTAATLRLPRSKTRRARPVEPAATESSAVAASAVAGTVLYVEDNAINVLLVEQILARWPAVRLLVAVDGTSGLALAAGENPDLILLDMQLPDMTGLQVLEVLRHGGAKAHTPVFCVSASAMDEDVQAAMAGGANGYWLKPLDVPKFLAGVSTALGLARDAEARGVFQDSSLQDSSLQDDAPPPTAAPAAPKLVLVADDFDGSADMLAELIGHDPRFRGLAARDGAQALALVLSEHPDVAILDWDMPQLSGVEVARQVRKAFGDQRPLLIALTGRRAMLELQDAQVFDHVLRKPPRLKELIHLLASA